MAITYPGLESVSVRNETPISNKVLAQSVNFGSNYLSNLFGG